MEDKINLSLSQKDSKLDENFEQNLYLTILSGFKIANQSNTLNWKINDYQSLLNKLQRDKGLIEALVNSIINQIYYQQDKQNYLFLASKLLKEIACRHPFYDSNKRTAFLVAQNILKRRGIVLTFSVKEGIDFMLKIVEHGEQRKMSEEEQIKYISIKFLENSNLKFEKSLKEQWLRYVIISQKEDWLIMEKKKKLTKSQKEIIKTAIEIQNDPWTQEFIEEMKKY